MAGDQVSGTTMYYYPDPVVNHANDPSVLTNLLISLTQAISGSGVTSGLTKSAASSLTGLLNGSAAFSALTDPDQSSTTGSNPKAYLSVPFFDERFNFISEGSTSLRVSQSGSGASPLVFANIKAPKNGYAYVYVSNVSDQMVYFDNLQVTSNRGRIIEENHYYAYGLKIASLSSQKISDPNEGYIANHDLYNDKELIDDADLNWYDYGFRSYDAQIGRFPQLDPLTDEYPELTPYQYAGDEPIANVDVDGLEPWRVLEPVVITGHKTVQAAKTGFNVGKAANLAAKAADIATDFIPIVSGGKDIYRGIQSGNGWQVALRVGGIALDIITLGSSSVAKGIIKTGIREGVGEEAKEFISKGIFKELPKFGCFVKGTPVWTADSTKAIEKIRAGDYVHAYDINKKQVVKKKVTKAYIREVNQLVKIDYRNEVIFTTTEHPFYINNIWVKAEKLQAGDSLFIRNGKIKIPVQRVTVIDTVVTVYNITVADAHDYYVGHSKVLVHNNPCVQAASKIEAKIVKQTSTKVDYLLKDKGQALIWARRQLGHATEKIYNHAGKLVGWRSSKGSVYWGHGDWGKGVGSSTFPHLNYNINGVKGHLFLENKISNRGMMDSFLNYFK